MSTREVAMLDELVTVLHLFGEATDRHTATMLASVVLFLQF